MSYLDQRVLRCDAFAVGWPLSDRSVPTVAAPPRGRNNEKAPNASSGPFLCLVGVHPPYAAEAFLFTPLRSATLLSLVFAAFSSLRFVVSNRTTSSWPSSSAQAISVP